MPPIRVNIIGSGLAGLCLANALIGDKHHRYTVEIYEVDDSTFDSDRGGYQIRLGQDGIDGIRGCLDKETYDQLGQVWGQELSRAPALVDPTNLRPIVYLNDLKLYPKSRAVPRQALKEYLMRLPNEQNKIHWKTGLVDCLQKPSATGKTEWICKFNDGSESVCDLVIAADGSRSKVSSIFKVNNKTTMPKGVIQGRCAIPKDVYDQLPSALPKYGSMLFLTKGIAGFCAVYENYVDGDRKGLSDSFLFWGINLEGEMIQKAKALPDSDARVTFALDYLRSQGCEESGLPTIVKLGNHNVRCGPVSSSTPPVNWRKGEAALGRIILTGDSIHAMTPGRGQGANQALKDASMLAQQMLAIGPDEEWTDDRALRMAEEFDTEMYKRAFGWVKASEQATAIDTSSLSGYLTTRALAIALTAAGHVVSVAETIGLRSPTTVGF